MRKTNLIIIGVLIIVFLTSLQLVKQNNPIQASASGTNLNNIDFKKDWFQITETTNIPVEAKLENFKLLYSEDGTIKELRYVIYHKNGDFTTQYDVRLVPEGEVYVINQHRVETIIQYENLVEAQKFFAALNDVDKKGIKPNGQFESLGIQTSGALTSYAIEDNEKYQLKGDKLIQISNAKLPITGYYFTSYGIKKVRETKDTEIFKGTNEMDIFYELR